MRNRKSELKLPMRVWDAPMRLFHWAIVVLIVTSFIAIKMDHTKLHLLSGYAVLTLVLFRVVWGIIGSETARFSHFLRSPMAALRYLLRFRDRAPDTAIGHNAAGGWMTLVMLLDMLVQVGTGLCANDDGDMAGPLAKYVGKARSDFLSAVHGWNFYVLLGLIVLHVLAVTAYAAIKRHDLVRPMVTGKKRLPATARAPRMASPLLALLVLVVIAAGVWVLATRV
ncbi:MAG TPA: cytochrome b/b6 domain-containing protein [Acetobacteraceae bacterium]